MDIFRNIRNDTFGYGGITAKRSKHQERPLLMICSFTNCWYPGTSIYPYYSTVHLLYLWDKKVRLSVTNAIKCPSLTKNKRAFFSLAKPNIWHFPFKVMMDNNYFFVTLNCYHQRTTLQRKSRQKPNSSSCLFEVVYLGICRSLVGGGAHWTFSKNLTKLLVRFNRNSISFGSKPPCGGLSGSPSAAWFHWRPTRPRPWSSTPPPPCQCRWT